MKTQYLLFLWMSLVLYVMPRTAAGQGTTGLPRPVSQALLQDYTIRYLHLSDAQSEHVRQLHERYISQWGERFNEDLQRFRERWNSAHTTFEKFSGQSMAETRREANEIAEMIRSKLQTANDMFFDEVELILAEQQLPQMQRVRLAHDRYSYRRSTKMGLRERGVDPVALVEKLDLTPEDQVKVDLLLLDQEPVVVTALRQAVEVDQRRDLLIFECIELARQNQLHGVDPDRVNAANSMGTEADRIALPSAKRLVAANRSLLRQLLNILSPESGADLQRLYNEAAYPEIYPDRMFAGPYYDEIIESLDDLNDVQLEALAAMRDIYTREHVRLSKESAAAIYDLSLHPFTFKSEAGTEQFAADIDVHVAKEARLQEKLRAAATKREELDLAQVGQIRFLLTVEQLERVPKWEWESRLPLRLWARLARAETGETEKAQSEWNTQERKLRWGTPPPPPPAHDQLPPGATNANPKD